MNVLPCGVSMQITQTLWQDKSKLYSPLSGIVMYARSRWPPCEAFKVELKLLIIPVQWGETGTLRSSISELKFPSCTELFHTSWKTPWISTIELNIMQIWEIWQYS